MSWVKWMAIVMMKVNLKFAFMNKVFMTSIMLLTSKYILILFYSLCVILDFKIHQGISLIRERRSRTDCQQLFSSRK